MRKPYWRNAIEIDPYRKEQVPICRFECRSSGRTFSLLPIQLIPYHQYTLAAVITMVILATKLYRQGQAGCEGSVEKADAESSVTPFLVWCWLGLVVAGLRRAHVFLTRAYDLRQIRSGWGRASRIAELTAYLKAISVGGRMEWPRDPVFLVGVYAKATGRFLFGNSA
jgi:hypothetical protein